MNIQNNVSHISSHSENIFWVREVPLNQDFDAVTSAQEGWHGPSLNTNMQSLRNMSD